MSQSHRQTAPALERLLVGAMALAVACAGSEPGSEPASQNAGVPTGQTATLGGQSGGEGNNFGRPALVCGCLTGSIHEQRWDMSGVRATVVSVNGRCGQLEVVEVLGRYSSLRRGNLLAGELLPLCGANPERQQLTTGDEVLAFIEPGTSDCPEAEQCIEEDCGPPPTEGDLDMGAEAIAWLNCQGGCIDGSEATCNARATQNNTLRFMKIQEDLASFYWAGEVRQESVEQLSGASCLDRQTELANAYRGRRKAERAAELEGANSTLQTNTATEMVTLMPEYEPSNCPVLPID